MRTRSSHRSARIGERRDRFVPAHGVFRVVLIYAICGALWILLSDTAAAWLFREQANLVLAGTVKGWLFIAITSALLYGLIRRLLARAAAERGQTEAELRAEVEAPYAPS